MALLTLLQLTLEGVDSDVYRFLEGICDLVCEEFATCDEELDGRLLIAGYLGLNHLEDNLRDLNVVGEATQLIELLVDERLEGFCCIEVQCLNSDIHISFLFLCSWMSVIHLLYLPKRRMSIADGGRYLTMSHELLDGQEVCSSIEHIGRE